MESSDLNALVLARHRQILVATYDVCRLSPLGTGYDSVILGVAGHPRQTKPAIWEMFTTLCLGK